MSSHANKQRPKSRAPNAAPARSSASAERLRPAPATPRSAATSSIRAMAIEPMPVARLRPYRGNARTHSKKQIRQIADSIRRFGFTNPVLIGQDGEIIAGHGRVEAAKLIGLENVPTVRLAHLDAAQRRAYVLVDNKLALNAGWDQELLAIELQGLIALDFDIEVTGFSSAEIDVVIDEAREGAPNGPAKAEAEDEVPIRPGDPACAVTRPGDVWCLDRHRLICGDARDHDVFERLMGAERADLIFTDPPYNVPIDGHSRSAPPPTPTRSGSATAGAIAPTCGTTPGSTPRGVVKTCRCIRPSSRSRWSPRPSRTVRGGAKLSSIRLVAPAPP